MEKRNYADRFKVNCGPSAMAGFTNEESPWNEDEQSIAAGLAWGEEKERLLSWVRWQMRWRLREKQRRAIELYYFEDLTYAEIGLRMGCSSSAAYRSVRRGLEKLRESARREGVGWSLDR